MTSGPLQIDSTDAAEFATRARLSSINAVFGLSLVLTQASSPTQAMRLVTTAVPSIAPGYTAVAWHPSRFGEFYERAPAAGARALAHLFGAGRLDLDRLDFCWAFPLTAARGHEPVFLVATGDRDLSPEEVFLLSVLAQTRGTVIANHDLVAEVELRNQADRERDIAQARAVELVASEARQRAVLEAALDAVVSIDHESRVTYANTAFEITFGYRADEIIGRELAEIIVPPSLRDAHRNGFARYLTTLEPHILGKRIEVAAMRVDGTEFPAEVTVTRTGLPGPPSFTGFVRDITERRQAQQDLMASRARLVASADAARLRVTRDLHDGAQQQFVTSLINLQLADQKWESAPERAKELLGLGIRDARHGIEDLREMAAGIHPAILTHRGLATAIDALAARMPIPVGIDVLAGRLPESIEANVYFFCAEALTNVAKHAQATEASVSVQLGDGRCHVEIRDNGVGGAHPRSESSGLAGLHDRIGAVDGTMEILSSASTGTVLRAEVPVRL
ncbi:MAG: domain S-box protein [Pseudonocardiales bacterium]|nr:domain S-box protein [Pseudonocardiales bacterium]